MKKKQIINFFRRNIQLHSIYLGRDIAAFLFFLISKFRDSPGKGDKVNIWIKKIFIRPQKDRCFPSILFDWIDMTTTIIQFIERMHQIIDIWRASTVFQAVGDITQLVLLSSWRQRIQAKHNKVYLLQVMSTWKPYNILDYEKLFLSLNNEPITLYSSL